MAKKNHIKNNKNIFTWIIVVLLLFYSFTMIIPLVWGFIQTFKDGMIEWEFNKFGFPEEWIFENYVTAVTTALRIYVQDGTGGHFVYTPEMIFNSLLLSTSWTLVSLISHMLVAYACARFKFKLNGVIYGTVLITMLLPIVGALPSFIRVMKLLRLYDTYIGTLCMKAGFTGTYFLVFYAAFKSVDMAYTEAARIDGANNFQVMFQIIFPLVFSTTMGVCILSFIAAWNDYYTQMIYLPSMPTIAYGLFDSQSYGDSAASSVTTVRIAVCFVACIPTFLMFMAFRKKIMGNIVIGGVK